MHRTGISNQITTLNLFSVHYWSSRASQIDILYKALNHSHYNVSCHGDPVLNQLKTGLQQDLKVVVVLLGVFENTSGSYDEIKMDKSKWGPPNESTSDVACQITFAELPEVIFMDELHAGPLDQTEARVYRARGRDDGH